MRIGCIGWGSLLWDPRSLPMASPFREDGPGLPIEFSRVSADGRVTLVIDPAATPIPTWWTRLDTTTLEAAVEGLGRRERIAPGRWSDWIGVAVRSDAGRGGGQGAIETRHRIAGWLEQVELDAVVWTALPARRPNGSIALPETDELVEHLRALEGTALARAEEYIRRAPPTVRTQRRAHFETALGWTPSDAPPNAATPGAAEAPADVGHGARVRHVARVRAARGEEQG